MRVFIPQIAWHARDPVLTVDVDPKGKTAEGYYRIVTGGADSLLLVWHLTDPQSVKAEVKCVAQLNRHQRGINVVRFSPCGKYIAAGDDDAIVFVWRNESITETEEVWNIDKTLRRHVEDVSDLSWSPDSNFLVSGSVDNTAVLWDVKKGTAIHFWSEREHTGFVQGVAYDPLGQFSASMCIDRHLRFFDNKTGKVLHKTLKYPPAWLGTVEDDTKENKPAVLQAISDQPMEVDKDNSNPSSNSIPSAQAGDKTDNPPEEKVEEKPLSEMNVEKPEVKPPPKKPAPPLNRLFHDDSLKTFCRRLGCSPRGELMIVPGGLLPPVENKKRESRQGTPVAGEEEDSNSKDKTAKKSESEQNNAALIFCRNSWTNPCAVIPTLKSYSIAARFNPVYYQRDREAYEYDAELQNSQKKHERMISCVGKLRPPQNKQGTLLDMPYRLIYAIATNDSILIGDTASAEPLACIKNIHCTRLTDVSWSPDGLFLIASSTDGYCSIVSFEQGELGAEFKYDGEFPALTPVCFPIAPPEPKPVKVKEPKVKVPKEPKEPKEKKEKEPKEKVPKEKAPKEKKAKAAKEKSEKEVTTPVENKEEKKKKPMTILKMFAKSSPSSSPAGTLKTPSTPNTNGQQTHRVDETKTLPSTPSTTTVGDKKEGSTPSPVVPAIVTPKPTFLDSWVKKTPTSSKSEQKKPRRVQLITLPTADSLKPSMNGNGVNSEKAVPKTDSVSNSGLTKEVVDPPSNNTPKAPEKDKSDKSVKPQQISSTVTEVNQNFTKTGSPNLPPPPLENSPKPNAAKQPRRVQLISLDDPKAKKLKSDTKPDPSPNKQVSPPAQTPKSDAMDIEVIELQDD